MIKNSNDLPILLGDREIFKCNYTQFSLYQFSLKYPSNSKKNLKYFLIRKS